MLDSSKRRGKFGEGQSDERGLKRSKGGSGGKWNTPHQRAKTASCRNEKIEPGDSGIWVTCARGMEEKAREEARGLFDECAEKIYGLVPASRKFEEERDEEDIEASIEKEVQSITAASRNPDHIFTPVSIDLQCVLFFKTAPLIAPVEFVESIVNLIVADPKAHRTRYVNRLTPIILMAKATEKGLDELCGQVLSRYFRCNPPYSQDKDGCEKEQKAEAIKGASYAIRPTIRNHNSLKRDVIIKQIAASISDSHKVDLTNPDHVIIVEVYQTVCGLSVVAGKDWERLKRFNLAELYSDTIHAAATDSKVS
ncbi:hypothetical protein K3495_g7890 [Podosphaera aphanis]|nr:hypothetical protein K3495_g7890 [Podosphaera aphanis]